MANTLILRGWAVRGTLDGKTVWHCGELGWGVLGLGDIPSCWWKREDAASWMGEHDPEVKRRAVVRVELREVRRKRRRRAP